MINQLPGNMILKHLKKLFRGHSESILSIPLMIILLFVNCTFHTDKAHCFDPPLENTHQDYILWEIGKETYSPDEFNLCPGNQPIEHQIDANGTLDLSAFPSGLAKDNQCLPAEIRLSFFCDHYYSNSKLIFSIHIYDPGKISIYLDNIPIAEFEIDTDFGWEKVIIPLPHISRAEHTITLERKDEYEYDALFDYIRLIGDMDTDQDGTGDKYEGNDDWDNDGIPDDRDADCAVIPVPEEEWKIILILQTDDNQTISPAPFLQEVSLKDTASFHDPGLLEDGPPDTVFKYGFLSGHIGNLEKDQEVDLLLLFTPSLPLYGIEEVWTKNEQSGDGWLRLNAPIDMQNNQIHIAFADGGITDTDREVNGQITFVLGLGLPTRLTPYSMNHCFLGSIDKR
jgi:hypothetical protein